MYFFLFLNNMQMNSLLMAGFKLILFLYQVGPPKTHCKTFQFFLKVTVLSLLNTQPFFLRKEKKANLDHWSQQIVFTYSLKCFILGS